MPSVGLQGRVCAGGGVAQRQEHMEHGSGRGIKTSGEKCNKEYRFFCLKTGFFYVYECRQLVGVTAVLDCSLCRHMTKTVSKTITECVWYIL